MPSTKQAKGKGRKIGTNKKKCERYYLRNRLEVNKKRKALKLKKHLAKRKERLKRIKEAT